MRNRFEISQSSFALGWEGKGKIDENVDGTAWRGDGELKVARERVSVGASVECGELLGDRGDTMADSMIVSVNN